MDDSSDLRGVYAAGVLQFMVTCALCFFCPAVHTTLVSYSPAAGFNATHPAGAVRTFGMGLALPCVVVSSGVVGFVSATIGLAASGHDGNQYTHETLSEMGPWDVSFWFVVTGVHLVCVLAACSPGDGFACIVAVYAMVKALHSLCAPASEEPSIMRVNSSVAGYAFGMGVALYCVPPDYDNRYVIFFLLALLDYILVVGHTWDKSPTVRTVGNCRLCWALATSLCMGALYAGFNERMLMH